MIGFANVPSERLEAAAMSGATSWKSFKWVRFDAAFPTLILGINQTVMMAFAMLVITALVGTQDLGQQVFIALSQAKVGEGILAGHLDLSSEELISCGWVAAVRNASLEIRRLAFSKRRALRLPS